MSTMRKIEFGNVYFNAGDYAELNVAFTDEVSVTCELFRRGKKKVVEIPRVKFTAYLKKHNFKFSHRYTGH